jgi:hypothetical protein
MAWFENLRRLNRALAAAVRRVLLPAFLFAAYFIGLGLTWLAGRIFRPSLFESPDLRARSFWRDAEGYEPDWEDCLRQS